MGMSTYFIAVTEKEIASLLEDPDTLMALLYPDGEAAPGKTMDVDKAWHALHFMLNGAPMPREGQPVPAIFGGEPIGEDIHYGPARLLRPHEVKAISTALNAIGDDDMRARYAPEQMTDAQVYPEIWDDDDALDYVMLHYRSLVEFYGAAAARGDGLIVYIG